MDKRISITFSHATIIAVFLFLMQNCLYFIDPLSIHIPGAVNYADSWLLLYIVYVFFIGLRYMGTNTGKPYFLLEVLAVPVICMLSAIQANRLFGQSVVMGLRPQRFFVIVMLGYFALRKLFISESISIEQLKNVIMDFAILECLLGLLQALVYNYFVFLNCTANQRYGSVRLYISNCVITLAMFFAMDGLINKKKVYKGIVVLVLGIMFLFFVNKGRLVTISIIATLLSAYVLMKGISVRKVIYGIIFVALIVVFTRTELYKDLTDTVAIEDGQFAGDTLDIRSIGRARYFERMETNPVLGGGFPNELNFTAANAAGYQDQINPNDNGIFGLMYIYGYLGVALFVILFLRLLYMAWVVYINNNIFSPLMYVIFVILEGVNIVGWYWQYDGILVLVIVMCMTEVLYLNTDKDTNKKKKKIKFIWKR